MSEDTAPSNVIAAIAAVMRELPAIGKDSEVSGDGPRYKFRGIEAITAAIQDLLGKHGIVFVPRVVGMERRDINVGSKGAVWDEYSVTVEYDVYGPGGVTDCLPQPVRVVQLGRDNSDKGMAKAMTMAYKTVLVQVFCIGDSKNDADNERHENADHQPTVRERAAALQGAARSAFAAWLIAGDRPTKAADWDDDALRAVAGWLDHLAKTGEVPPVAESPQAEHERLHAEAARLGVQGPRDTPAPGAPDPPREAAQEPVAPTEGVSAPVPAPQPGNGAGAEQDARARAATLYVKNLDQVEILTEYGSRNETAPRLQKDQRERLVEILVADQDWRPAAEQGALA